MQQLSPFSFMMATTFLFLSCGESQNKMNGLHQSATAPDYTPHPYVELAHADWTKNATIYEANIRQFTPEGNFAAFAEHLPRLKALGVDIIWLMPIHPIGEKNRKGSMGSYYSIKDYYAVNPEFGTMEEFKAMVKKIHDLHMHVIIDWVANHSAWDNPLAAEHPEWYTKTIAGDFQPTPWYDWEDIIDFDYDQPGLRQYMTEAMVHWVKETDIDGFRCDVAGFIPVDFWEQVRASLEQVKPVFLLAEWESRDLHRKAFDMTYAWSLWDKLRDVTTGGKNIGGLVEYMAHDVNTFPAGAYRMNFTDNHDKNSWEGNQYANFGAGLEAAMVFCSVVNGMPLIYGGQEAGLDRSLKFFDKDLIDWKTHRNASIYQKLFELKHSNEALWNGEHGGTMIRVHNNQPQQVISFYRERNGDKVLPIVNFSAQPATVHLDAKYFAGKYTELFTGKSYVLEGDDEFTLNAWGYLVLTQSKPANTAQ